MSKNKPLKTIGKKGFPCPPELCGKGGACRHLTPSEFKLYSIMMAFAKAGQISRGHDQLECTAAVVPTLCNAFNCGRNTIDALLASLCTKGWVIKREGRQDQKTGKLLPNVYKMIEHPEFVKEHPGSCPPLLYASVFDETDTTTRRGDKIKNDFVPENFWKPETKIEDIDLDKLPLPPEIRLFKSVVAVWWASSDSEEYRKWFEEGLLKARAALVTTPKILGEVSSDHSQVSGSGPLPESKADHSQRFERTTPRNLGGILEKTILNKSTHTHELRAVADATVAEKRVCVLIQKFTTKEGEPPRISNKADLVALAECKSEVFDHAGDAWLQARPWNAETQFPFLAFINGFDGYAVMKVINDRDAAVEEQNKKVREDTVRWHGSKQPLDSIPAEYILTLQPDDQEYIVKVKAATTVSDLPADAPARSYKLNELWSEELHQRREKEKREEQEAADGLFK